MLSWASPPHAPQGLLPAELNPNAPVFIPADVKLLQKIHASEPAMVAAAVQESIEPEGREDSPAVPSPCSPAVPSPAALQSPVPSPAALQD